MCASPVVLSEQQNIQPAQDHKETTMQPVLLTFKAGICDFDEETKTITPLPVKGVITVSAMKDENEDEDDEDDEDDDSMVLYDFVWKPTENSVKKLGSEQFMLLPGENVWKQIDTCKDGRVFVLIFSSGVKKFFWLQDKVEDHVPKNTLTKQDLKNLETMMKIMNGDSSL